MRTVYFDESGNTGQDLLNPDDPMFVLASCCFDADQQKTLLQHFSHYIGPELKASRLRKTAAGQRAILEFLEHSSVNSSTAAAHVTHKPFMVVTKYCDIVLEPSARAAGLNFYERGLNIAVANLLTTSMPVFLNPRSWKSFLAGFVRVVRERSQVAFRDFVRQAELIHSHLQHTNPEMANWFAPVLMLRPEELLPLLDGRELDPLVPAYYILVDHWGKTLGERFEIRPDQSKALAKERARLLDLADQEIAPVRQGFDRRTMEFPLKVAAITPVDSATVRQVQLADVVAGVLTGALKSKDRAKDGTFEHRALRLCFDKCLVVGAVWPTQDVTPEQLGTDEPPSEGQFDLARYTTMVAQKHPATRKLKR